MSPAPHRPLSGPTPENSLAALRRQFLEAVDKLEPYGLATSVDVYDLRALRAAAITVRARMIVGERRVPHDNAESRNLSAARQPIRFARRRRYGRSKSSHCVSSPRGTRCAYKPDNVTIRWSLCVFRASGVTKSRRPWTASTASSCTTCWHKRPDLRRRCKLESDQR